MKRILLAGGVLTVVLTASAEAYVGPGVGVTMIGWFAGFVVIVGAALWAALRLPLQWLLARMRPVPEKADAADEPTD
ncbi:MAG: hypothetical protein GF331_05315 [Chitinivibrionales bacterium]|nr:hypothetical protein [Chitinivibrionales bacterium]